MKPVILIFSAFYLPGYRGGGPIRTIANMVERLSDDFDFYIVTSDHDLGDSTPYPNIHADTWNAVGKGRVYYASKAGRSLANFARIMRETQHDMVYLNSFFAPRFTLQPAIARWLGLAPKTPVLLAPRGEFSAGALAIKSWKKWPYLQLASITGLFAGFTWHASTEVEAADIRWNFRPTRGSVQVARNIVVASDLLPLTPPLTVLNDRVIGTQARRLKICFLSRISPMKNLVFALQVLAQVSVKIEFNVYGPKEDSDYWKACHALIQDLPANITASYCGSVDHADVRQVISAHEIFFVPSLGENFGHVYIESLSAGVPILVSDLTPWRDLRRKGIGWDIPLDQALDFVNAIEGYARLSNYDRFEIQQRCIDFARRQTEDPLVIEHTRGLFFRQLETVDGRFN